MKFFLSIFFSLFIFCSIQGQKRMVIDAETKKALPYCTIKVLHTIKGKIADSTGSFSIIISPTDSVYFSCVGYRDTVIVGRFLEIHIALIPRISKIEEVTVQSKKVIRTVFLGNGVEFIDKKIKCDTYNPEKDDIECDCIPWGSGGNAEFVEKIDLLDSLSTYTIESIAIPIGSYFCPTTIMFHLYSWDSVSGYPKEALFAKQFDVKRTIIKKGKLLLDLTSEKFFIKEPHFFIGISWWDISDAADYTCYITLALPKNNKNNTFSRSINSPDYKWIPFKYKGFNTGFIVTLKEMK